MLQHPNPYKRLQPSRNWNCDEYRFGFQGQEADNEIKGDGNSINYKYRVHDPRLGRFMSIDPLAPKYPFYSPYAFSGNRVIDMVELEGLEPADPPMVGMEPTPAMSNEDGKMHMYTVQEASTCWKDNGYLGPETEIRPENYSWMYFSKNVSSIINSTNNSSSSSSPILTTSSLDIRIQSITYIGANGYSLSRLNAYFPLNATTGVWNNEATTGLTSGFSSGLGLKIEYINATVGDITFFKPLGGSTMAEIMNKAPYISQFDASALLKFTKLSGYDQNEKIWTAYLFGGGMSAGVSWGGSMYSWKPKPLSPNDSLIRALNDSTLSGGNEFLYRKYGSSNRDSILNKKPWLR